MTYCRAVTDGVRDVAPGPSAKATTRRPDSADSSGRAISMEHADPQYVAEASESWDDEMIECREGRHDFGKRTTLDEAFDDREHTFARVRRCPRCHTEQHKMWYEPTGSVVKSTLDYRNAKEGYLLPAGTGRMDAAGRDQIRREIMRRNRARLAEAAAARRKVAAAKRTSKRTTSKRARKAA